MTTALICVRGFRTSTVLDKLRERLHPSLSWIILHVIDSRPEEQPKRAPEKLPSRDDRQHQVHGRIAETSWQFHQDVRAEAEQWLADHGRAAEIVLVEGRAEHEILRIAEEFGVSIIAIGDLSEPGPRRLPPVAQYVVDHARCDVLLVR